MLLEAIDFLQEYPRIVRGLGAQSRLRLLAKTLGVLPRIVRERKLRSLDEEMSADLEVVYRGCRLRFPIEQIDACLAGLNDSPTFTALREMYFNDCYLWPFRAFSVSAVIDLGANRCFFAPIALKVLNADIYVGVEPNKQYDRPVEILLGANAISAQRVHIYRKFVAAESSDSTVTIPRIIQDLALDRVDLMKIDIEGHEYEIFRQVEWLDKVTSIVMELHPPSDKKSVLLDILQRSGFTAICSDARRRSVPVQGADYIFATRDPGLLRQRK